MSGYFFRTSLLVILLSSGVLVFSPSESHAGLKDCWRWLFGGKNSALDQDTLPPAPAAATDKTPLLQDQHLVQPQRTDGLAAAALPTSVSPAVAVSRTTPPVSVAVVDNVPSPALRPDNHSINSVEQQEAVVPKAAAAPAPESLPLPSWSDRLVTWLLTEGEEAGKVERYGSITFGVGYVGHLLEASVDETVQRGLSWKRGDSLPLKRISTLLGLSRQSIEDQRLVELSTSLTPHLHTLQFAMKQSRSQGTFVVVLRHPSHPERLLHLCTSAIDELSRTVTSFVAASSASSVNHSFVDSYRRPPSAPLERENQLLRPVAQRLAEVAGDAARQPQLPRSPSAPPRFRPPSDDEQ